MNFKKLLKNYKETLNPQSSQEDKVFLKVFGYEKPTVNHALRLGSWQANFNILTSIFMNKYLISGAFTLAAVTFVAAPLSYTLLNNSRSSNDSMLSTTSNEQDGSALADELERVEKELGEVKNKTEEAPSLGSVSLEDRDTYYGMVQESREANNYLIDPAPGNDWRLKGFEDGTTEEADRVKEQDALLSLETNDIRDDYNKIKTFVSEVDGYIVTTQFSGGEDSYATIVFRVPADEFDTALDKIRGLDLDVISESVETIDWQNDLTEYTTLRDTNDQKIKDLEQQLAAATDQATKDSLQSQINSLKSQNTSYNSTIDSIKSETNFSTIEVNLDEKEPSLIGENFSDIEETIELVATFWAQVLIYACVPLIALFIMGWMVRRIIKSQKLKIKNQI